MLHLHPGYFGISNKGTIGLFFRESKAGSGSGHIDDSFSNASFIINRFSIGGPRHGHENVRVSVFEKNIPNASREDM
jgi:hypothetical protein